MVVESKRFLIDEISNLLVKRDLQQVEPLCLKAIGLYLSLSDWDSLVGSIVLYGRTLRIKSKYSGDKSFMEAAFKQFKKGMEYSDKVTRLELKIDLILEYAITYIDNNQFEEAEDILNELECNQASSSKLLVKCLNTKCQLKASQFKFKEALQYANKALAEAERLEEHTSLNNSYRSVGMVYSRQHNFSKIPDVFNKVLELSTEIGDIEGKMISYNNLAVYNASISNYKIALENFLASYELANSIGFKPHSARCLVNIGAIFSQLDNLEFAKEHFEKVLKEYIDVIGVNTKAVILINLGEISIKQGNLEVAENTIQLCLEFSLKENYQQFICLAYHHLGEIQLKKGNSEKALDFALKAKAYFEKLGDVNGKEENLIILGKCYKQQGDLKNAATMAKLGLELAQKLENYVCIAKASDLLAEIHGESGQFEKAFQYQKSARQTQKKIYEQKTSKALLDLEIQYDMRKKEREIEILKSTNTVQAQLLEKQKAFEQQNKLLLQANEELKQFTYAVSHDLREPVRMIESYIQILKNKYSDSWNDEQHEFFHYVSDGAFRMRLLLKDLLEYATLGGNGVQEQSSFNLKSIVHAVELDLSLQIQESNTTILAENDVELHTNQNLFRLVIQNLVSNAIKFRKEQEDPLIVIKAEASGQDILITVEDNGIGIDEIYQDKVFRLFHRIHSKDKYKGTGIGLALCAKIIRLLEGEISLSSMPGEGAVFQLRFPN